MKGAMANAPQEIIRDDIRSMAGYRVADSRGMIKLDAMENPYPLPEELRPEIARLAESAAYNRYPDAGAVRLKARLREVMRDDCRERVSEMQRSVRARGETGHDHVTTRPSRSP